MTVTGSITVDTLRAMYLGNMRDFCKFTVWFLLQSGAFGELGTATEQVSIAMMALARELDSWYKARKRKRPKLSKTTKIGET